MLPGLAAAPSAAPRSVRLTDAGSDRATGYVMSNKIARRGPHLVCTWLDVHRQNQWALVDPANGTVLRTGAIGDRRVDNHCGAALTTAPDATLHLLVGAHHGAFVHYRWPASKDHWEPVDDGKAVGISATYPSLVCDRHGTLHVVYRRETRGRDAHLLYCRRPGDGTWSKPVPLARLGVNEHSWLTNAIETDASGRLHIVISNPLPVPSRGPDARYYGASHLYSDDAGATWRQFGDDAPLATPADAARLRRIEAPMPADFPAERIEARYGGERGPGNSYYHKMVLSNPVIDARGRVGVIVHNLLAGDAQLYRHEIDGAPKGAWLATPLAPALRAIGPDYLIRHCGQLSRRRDGTLEAVLMVSPRPQPEWGAKGTRLLRLRINTEGQITHTHPIAPPGPELPDVPCWMPTLERFSPHAPVDRPALLYTRGLNAGGYSNNINTTSTEVWLEQA